MVRDALGYDRQLPRRVRRLICAGIIAGSVAPLLLVALAVL